MIYKYIPNIVVMTEDIIYTYKILTLIVCSYIIIRTSLGLKSKGGGGIAKFPK